MARDVPEELFLYRTGMKEKIILLEFSASVILSCLHEFFFFSLILLWLTFQTISVSPASVAHCYCFFSWRRDFIICVRLWSLNVNLIEVRFLDGCIG